MQYVFQRRGRRRRKWANEREYCTRSRLPARALSPLLTPKGSQCFLLRRRTIRTHGRRAWVWIAGSWQWSWGWQLATAYRAIASASPHLLGLGQYRRRAPGSRARTMCSDTPTDDADSQRSNFAPAGPIVSVADSASSTVFLDFRPSSPLLLLSYLLLSRQWRSSVSSFGHDHNHTQTACLLPASSSSTRSPKISPPSPATVTAVGASRVRRSPSLFFAMMPSSNRAPQCQNPQSASARRAFVRHPYISAPLHPPRHCLRLPFFGLRPVPSHCHASARSPPPNTVTREKGEAQKPRLEAFKGEAGPREARGRLPRPVNTVNGTRASVLADCRVPVPQLKL